MSVRWMKPSKSTSSLSNRVKIRRKAFKRRNNVCLSNSFTERVLRRLFDQAHIPPGRRPGC